MTDLISDISREIRARLGELQPLINEYNELKAANTALGNVMRQPRPKTESSRRGRRSSATTSGSEPRRPGPAAPRGRKSRSATSKRQFEEPASTDLRATPDLAKAAQGWDPGGP